MSEPESTTIDDFKNRQDSKTYESYSQYQDSGEEWLGPIPSGWDATKLKFLIREKLTYGVSESPEKYHPDKPRYIRITDINDRGGLNEDVKKSIGTEISEDYLLQEDDILLARSGSVGKSLIFDGVEEEDAVFAGYLIRVRLKRQVNPMFFKYFCQTTNYWDWIESYSIESTIKNVSADKYKELVVPIPPINDQNRIVEYLNREIGDINYLIDKKEELLDLIEEKRMTIITDAVTQGFESDVKSRASGIPGVGQVPKDWELVPLKYSSRNISVGIVQKPSQYYVDEGVPALRSLNVKKNEIIEDDFVYISEEANKELKSTQVYAGDLVSVRSGDPGTTAVVPDELDGVNCIDLIIIREPDGYIPDFLSFLMNSEASTTQIEAGTEGAAQQHFNVEEVKELVFPKPSIEEQREILDWLSPRLKEIDELEEKIQEGIDRLKEYRTALITKAVTGQIDVRGGV